MIQFGTSGWRSIMAKDFTFANVRRVVHAIATHLKRTEVKGLRTEQSAGSAKSVLSPQSSAFRPVVVGYDTRFLSPEFAKMAAEILAAQGFTVLFSKDFVPTPVVSFQILRHKALGGINFTASHNPAEYNG